LQTGLGCSNQDFIGVGGLVGYDFGPVDLQVWATDTVWSQNTAEAGWTIWTRIGFRLWAPEAARPLSRRTNLATTISTGPAGNRGAFFFSACRCRTSCRIGKLL